MIPSFEGIRILCLGDLLLDRYISGPARRLSPEAPVPIISVTETRNVLGGAANVAHNIAAAGAQCTLVGVLGQDAAATTFENLLPPVLSITPLLFFDETRKTSVKTRIMVGHHQLVRLDEEDVDPISPFLIAKILQAVATLLEQHDLIVLSDYNKGTLPPAFLQQIIAEARSQGKPVLVDPKGTSYEKYRGASIITPNVKELGEVFGPCANLEEACAQAQHALSSYDWQAILLTCSERGMRLVTPKKVAQVCATQQEVFDVSGAGDTAMAYFSVGLASGLSLEEAMALANEAAGHAVRRSGTAVVSYTDLCAVSCTSAYKKVSPEGAYARVQLWRQAGLRVGFTNGCFDVLHPGHLSTIRTARAHCDRLIVGLNTDASIRLLKGENRPLQNEETRAEVLAALQDVDLIVLFDSYTPQALLEKQQPDFLVKGS
ncbi:MAG: bifunctional heptose 7-phosphate kinase/heptose 1-phosphate adenyltransferase [Holosporales bacterium]|jgi:D-beta-D-heptose 7-phosphate kinase/D-beta-D-heptose 1-phosphate adenosyltransferase|nr:bifunctional heptose 7-phosphate kinase/heptose 1-phosphate adenyltransferase [Holosporales bacterium]